MCVCVAVSHLLCCLPALSPPEKKHTNFKSRPAARRPGPGASKRRPESAKIAQKSFPSPVGDQLRSKSASGTIFSTIFD